MNLVPAYSLLSFFLFSFFFYPLKLKMSGFVDGIVRSVGAFLGFYGGKLENYETVLMLFCGIDFSHPLGVSCVSVIRGRTKMSLPLHPFFLFFFFFFFFFFSKYYFYLLIMS
jgi:hypothetical protein